MDSQFTKKQALELAKNTLVASGATEENALPLAHGIVAAELEGIKSHGFHYLPIYCLHLKCKKVKGMADPVVNSKSDVAFTVNADNGFAHRAITLGFNELVPAAKKNGIASLSISNSYNCGVLGYHTQALAKEKLIGIGFTNAPASIAPLGGKNPVVGTNPISIAIHNQGNVKILIDQSASVVAKSEISVRAKSGESIPTGWAFDADGNNTTDAATALKGTMAPSGGYKGFGIGLLVEIMTACLTGSSLGIEASSFADDKGGPPGTGQFFIAINPDLYSDSFEDKISSLVKAIETQEGSRIPGSKRLKNAKSNLDKPIIIKEELYNRIIAL